MKLTSLIADIMIPSSELYGVPAPEPSKINMPIVIIVVATVTIGVVTGAIILVKKMLKKKKNNNAQALYGPPENFKNKSKDEPLEDLYGCPRPDGMDE